jgi:large subunit ribosomal protein L15
MPLQRRLPKVGFRSRLKSSTAELRLHELAIPQADVIDIAALRKAHLISAQAERVKVILSGKLEKAVKVKGLALTKGARAAIEAAGGSIEE